MTLDNYNTRLHSISFNSVQDQWGECVTLSNNLLVIRLRYVYHIHMVEPVSSFIVDNYVHTFSHLLVHNSHTPAILERTRADLIV